MFIFYLSHLSEVSTVSSVVRHLAVAIYTIRFFFSYYIFVFPFFMLARASENRFGRRRTKVSDVDLMDVSRREHAIRAVEKEIENECTVTVVSHRRRRTRKSMHIAEGVRQHQAQRQWKKNKMPKSGNTIASFRPRRPRRSRRPHHTPREHSAVY